MPHDTVSAKAPPSPSRCAVVTGGTRGIGFEAARILAGCGFQLVLAARNPDTGNEAVAAIRAQYPQAKVSYEQLDTGSLASVRDFCHRIEGRHSESHLARLDLLLNCAGLARLRANERSADGYELQFAVNYLGHFALTGLLLPLLRRSAGARIVNVASVAHFRGRNDYGSIGKGGLVPFAAYCRSKLAMLVFAKELQRRFDEHGYTQKSIAAHPGFVATGLFEGVSGASSLFVRAIAANARMFGQSAAMGALPLVYAATAKDVVGGGYYGPDGFLGLKGKPAPARCARKAKDEEAANELWRLSERLTGVQYQF